MWPMVKDAFGCDCGRCASGCPCQGMNATELNRECGPSCGCELDRGNRLTQLGIKVQLMIVKDKRKGRGLHSNQVIKKGGFVCEYAGELLTMAETRTRQRIYDELTLGGKFFAALLVVREHLPSGNACMRINIDATRVGNVARFINHSCDGGNLSTVIVSTKCRSFAASTLLLCI